MIHGIKIKQATKEGSTFLRVGGVADFSFPKSKTRRGRVQGDGKISPTLMANSQDIWRLEEDKMKKYRLRNLTPRENWRLMGFSDEDFEKAETVTSNTQLNAQAGNSIVVNVLEAIFREMLPAPEKEEQK
nr:MAG TPA: Cytosine specific methyltransferase [Caudoviricetes sp.]